MLGGLLLLAAAAAAGDKVLKHDDGKRAGQQSSAGTGHVIAFRAPRGSWWAEAVQVYGARYGNGYDAARTPFRVSICDATLAARGTTEAAYSLFRYGRWGWVEVPLAEPVAVKGDFKVVVAFDPSATRGVFVGWSAAKKVHSTLGLPGGREKAYRPGREWMIRVKLTNRKPKSTRKKAAARANAAKYVDDFKYLQRTVRSRFPALRKKGVDWSAVCRAWAPRFKECTDDRTHILNVRRLLATLDDAHTSVFEAKVAAPSPAFDGLYPGGVWIAADRGRLLLRAAVPGHPILKKVKPGAELLTIDGRPAKRVHAEVRARLRTWSGWSSTHFLDARLSFQFFPFGPKKKLRLTLLEPSGDVATVSLARWGPGGKGLSRVAATLPDGVEAKGLAVARRLEDGLGYARILGGMNEATQRAFFAALDDLKGVKGILLDCRGMGGGGDGPAWAMAGRFFTERTPNGSAPPLQPTGAWQFDGPVVMLQDEREISSAETFTWAMTETGRVVSVGRPTGGATIIPRAFDAPSGLFRFRLGVTDRKTPIRGVQPEGIGTPPDILVPHEPVLLARHRDPVFAVGLEALRQLVAGKPRADVAALDPLAGHERAAFDWELALCDTPANPMPDFAGALARLEELAREDPALRPRAQDAAQRWKGEIEAQEAWRELGPAPDRKAVERFRRRFAGTRYGDAVE